MCDDKCPQSPQCHAVLPGTLDIAVRQLSRAITEFGCHPRAQAVGPQPLPSDRPQYMSPVDIVREAQAEGYDVEGQDISKVCKHYLTERIIALMPLHTHYVEPYFGGGAVLLAKDPVGVSEVVNDLHGELTNFRRVLQDENTFQEFQRVVEAVPFSQPEWERACESPGIAGGTSGCIFRVLPTVQGGADERLRHPLENPHSPCHE